MSRRDYPARIVVFVIALCLGAGACRTRKPEPLHESPVLTDSGHPQPERSAMHGKPLFSLRLDIETCPYDVYVNGGLVARDVTGDPAHEEHPINHWLRAGSNQIDVHMYRWPEDPDRCQIHVELLHKDADGDAGTPIKVMTLDYAAPAPSDRAATAASSPVGSFDSQKGFQASSEGDFRVGPVTVTQVSTRAKHLYSLSRSVEVVLPFPRWAFFGGERMNPWWEFPDKEGEHAAYQELLGAYRTLWRLLEKKDFDGFVTACAERSREIDLAFFKHPGETQNELRKQLESASSDPALQLASVETTKGKWWNYTVGTTGHLLALTSGYHGSAALRFERKDDVPFSIVFPVVFRKDGGRFIVTR